MHHSNSERLHSTARYVAWLLGSIGALTVALCAINVMYIAAQLFLDW